MVGATPQGMVHKDQLITLILAAQCALREYSLLLSHEEILGADIVGAKADTLANRAEYALVDAYGPDLGERLAYELIDELCSSNTAELIGARLDEVAAQAAEVAAQAQAQAAEVAAQGGVLYAVCDLCSVGLANDDWSSLEASFSEPEAADECLSAVTATLELTGHVTPTDEVAGGVARCHFCNDDTMSARMWRGAR